METEASAERRERRRGGGRRGRAADGPALEQLPWQQPVIPFPPLELVSADELEAIHLASLEILEDIGIDFLLPEARALMRQAGADVKTDSERVRIDRGLVEQALATTPETFTLHARNPAHNLEVGGNRMAFGCVSSPPNCSDMDRGRRPGNREDFRNLVRLSQYFNMVHFVGGYPVEPVDLHPSIRHLDALSDMARLTDKVFHAYSLGYERIRDGLEIARIARGVSDEQLEREPSLLTIINSSSPLRIDAPMLRGVMEMAARNQVTCVTPFTLAGAMAPVTLAGALAQQNAECLAGLVFAQVVRPGSPFIYGGFTSNVDMKSGAPAFGTPEYMKTAVIGGQLARRYRLPYRTSGVNAAN